MQTTLLFTNSFRFQNCLKASPLFVFSIGSRKQNGVSLLTPVSDSIFIALSDGTFLFSLHGSFKNHQHKALWLAVGIVSTNQVMVKWATIQSKMNGTIWKSIENLIRNWCQKFHTILLRVISLKNKQCTWFWYRMHYKWYFDFDHLPLWHKSVQWFGNHRDQTNGCHHYCYFSNLLRKNVLDLVEENSSIFC